MSVEHTRDPAAWPLPSVVGRRWEQLGGWSGDRAPREWPRCRQPQGEEGKVS